MRRSTVLLLAILLAGALPARGGEITACLGTNVSGCNQRALQHVPFKALVLEAISPDREALGEAVGHVMWRELLFAIRDMPGRGVILGTDFESQLREVYGEPAAELLDRRFHDAADEIARFLETQIAVWSAVVEDEGGLTLYGFVTLLPEFWEREPGLALLDAAGRPTGVASGLSHHRLNLAPQRYPSREALFGGPVTARCSPRVCPAGVPLRHSPSADAGADRVPNGTVLTAHDMSGPWIEVERPDGPRGYLEVRHADIGPRFVHAPGRRNVNLRPHPGARGADQIVATTDLDGRYEVLGMARVGEQEIPWYQIRTEAGTGWVAGWLLEPVHRFPVTHLMAGLFRFAAGQFERAESEFGHFLAITNDEDDHVARSVAYQLIAAGRASTLVAGTDASDSVLEPLRRAEELTPFDPAIFRARGLVHLVASGDVQEASQAFERAVSLSRTDPQNRELAHGLQAITVEQPLLFEALGIDPSALAVDSLVRQME